MEAVQAANKADTSLKGRSASRFLVSFSKTHPHLPPAQVVLCGEGNSETGEEFIENREGGNQTSAMEPVS